MMRNVFLVLGLVLGLGFALGLGACKKKPADKGAGKDHSSHMHKGEPGKVSPKLGKVSPKTGKVEVPAKGKAFKPPIAKASVPDGAWICDMGTVHYARGEKGDGVCPLCKMKLKNWSAKAVPMTAAPMANEHEGHMHAH